MKIIQALALGGLALAVSATPATAQHRAHARTTVTRVHGPLKILPHHRVKVCRTRWSHGHRVRKCHFN